MAMLPCEWSYLEIGKLLSKSGEINKREVYSRWAEAYASEEYEELVSLFRELIDLRVGECGVREKREMERLFFLGSRYEYMFWDAAYRKEGWPI